MVKYGRGTKLAQCVLWNQRRGKMSPAQDNNILRTATNLAGVIDEASNLPCIFLRPCRPCKATALGPKKDGRVRVLDSWSPIDKTNNGGIWKLSWYCEQYCDSLLSNFEYSLLYAKILLKQFCSCTIVPVCMRSTNCIFNYRYPYDASCVDLYQNTTLQVYPR